MPAHAAPSGLIGNTDAAGQVGRRVAARLASRGIRQRLVARDAAAVPSLPGGEVVMLDGDDDGTGLQITRGELDVVTDAVPRLTGHPARTLTEFLAGDPDSYAHLTGPELRTSRTAPRAAVSPPATSHPPAR